MAKAKSFSENEVPDLSAGLDQPSDEGTMAGKLAGWTASLPLIGHMGDFTPTLALRWLLWTLAVLLCLGGMAAVLAGTGIGYVAVGSLSSSISQPLDATSTALTDASSSISNYALVGANISNATASMSGGLRNLSAGLTTTSATLQALTSIPLIGSQMGGLSTAAGQIQQSSVGLTAAADSLDASGTAVSGATTTLYAVSADVSQISRSLQTAKTMAQGGLFDLQLAILAGGAGLELLLCATLCLALAYGPPRK